MMRLYTIFAIKKDALERGIANEVIACLEQHYEIIENRPFHLTREMVSELKENEWRRNWHPYPSQEVKEYSFRYESGDIRVLLCRVRNDEDAIPLGKKVKGNHHLAHLCDAETIRGKFHDRTIIGRIFTDKDHISYLCDHDGNRLCYVPNIIHAVDNDHEFSQHFAMFFPDLQIEPFSPGFSSRNRESIP